MKSFLWLPALLMAVALCLQPVAGVAQSLDEQSTEETSGSGTAKFLDFALCAASIAVATTGGGAVLAVLTCGKAAHTWWSE